MSQQSTRDRGIDVYREGKFTEAAKLLEEAGAADKTDRQAWLYPAAAYAHLGKRDDARNVLQNSRVIQKTNLPMYDSDVKITSKPRPDFGELGRSPPEDNVTFAYAVELRADGKVGVVIPLKAQPHVLEAFVAESAGKIQFKPAVKEGRAVTVIKVIEYTFTRF